MSDALRVIIGASARLSMTLDLAGCAQSANHAASHVFADQPFDGVGLFMLVPGRLFVSDQIAALPRS